MKCCRISGSAERPQHLFRGVAENVNLVISVWLEVTAMLTCGISIGGRLLMMKSEFGVWI